MNDDMCNDGVTALALMVLGYSFMLMGMNPITVILCTGLSIASICGND